MVHCEECKKISTKWKQLSFHRFPKDYSTWVKNMGRQDWVPRKYSTLCSEHFDSDCFDVRGNRKYLKPGSVPTIFKNFIVIPNIGENAELEKAVDPVVASPKILENASETISSECGDDILQSNNSQVEAIPGSNSEEIDSMPQTIGVAEHDHYYEDSPNTLRLKLNFTKEKLASARKEIKVLKQNVKRLKTTVTSLKHVVKRLKGSNKALSDKGTANIETGSEFCAVKNELISSVTSVEGFDEICRCCLLAENEICSIFEVQYDGKNFSELLHSCTSIHVEKDDMLPKNICYNCIKKVIECNDFKNQCFSSESTLKKNLLQKDNVKDESGEIEEIIILQQDDKESVSPDEDAECTDDISQDNNAENSEDDNAETEKIEDNNEEIKKIEATKKIKAKKVPTCRKCDETFETWDELRAHLKTESHLLRKNRICKYCNKTISNGHISQHMRVHTQEKPFQCEICSARFSIKSNLKRHIKSHTGEKSHKCKLCGKAFTRITAVKIHMRTHTGESKSSTGQKIYVCSECGKSYAKRINYMSHLHNTHAVDTYDGRQIPDSLVQCETCQKLFSSVAALRTHDLIHGERNFLCNYCGKSCFSKGALQSHQVVHKTEKPHKCPECPKSFGRITNLKLHILTHTGQKPFVCKVCGRAFTQPNHLRYHMRTHSGERPYACSYCGKSFALKGNLKVHIRTHTGETPYVCDVCGKGFYDSSSMKKHKKSHNVDIN